MNPPHIYIYGENFEGNNLHLDITLSVRFADYDDIVEHNPEEEEEPPRNSFMNLWTGYSYIPDYTQNKEESPLGGSRLSKKLLMAVEKWEKQKEVVPSKNY